MDLNRSNTEEYIRLNNFAGNKIIALFMAQKYNFISIFSENCLNVMCDECCCCYKGIAELGLYSVEFVLQNRFG